MISIKIVIPVVVAVLAFAYFKWSPSQDASLASVQKQIIDAWDGKIKLPERRFSNVAVGINACVDLIVNGVELLKLLNVEPGSAKDHASVNSLSDLQEAFMEHFSKGSAGERGFTDPGLYSEIIRNASTLPGAEWFVGGNAALIGQTIAANFADVQVHLVGPVGPRLSKLLHPKIIVPEASLENDDQVHLIMEYQVGEQWGGARASVATRFITSYDQVNSQLLSLETFFESLASVKPDAVLLSGLHHLENQEENLWHDRLQTLVDKLRKQPQSTPIHLELASMTNTRLMHSLADRVFKMVDAIGLNEEELSFASRSLDGPHPELMTSAGQPEIHKVVDTLAWLLQAYGYSEQNSHSSLARIHFHSLSFHVLATIPGVWDNANVAVAAGTRIAGEMACDTNNLTLQIDTLELRMPATFKLFPGDEVRNFLPSEPVIVFQHNGFDFHLSPVLICKTPLKTVGLGDAISATGILYSSFNPDAKAF